MTLRTLPDIVGLPRALYTAAQVRAFDRRAIEQHGLAGETLMERAGTAAFDLLRRHWPAARRIAVLVGTGNNGGDGFVVARLARAAGLEVQVLQLGDRDRLRGDAATQAARWRDSAGAWDDYSDIPDTAEVIVDAMLGTGLERPLVGRWAAAVTAVNRHGAPCLAIDIPSGLHSDSGAILGEAVRASATLSFIGLKLGLFTGDGPDCAGEVVFAGLGVPAAVYASELPTARRIDWDKQAAALVPRRRNSYKGHYGHVLVIGGDHGLGGAARIAAEAALRVGSGLVSLATRPAHVTAALAARPEIMVHAVEGAADLQPLLQAASVVAIGPGLGQGAWGAALFEAAGAGRRPLVIDADALRHLATTRFRRDDWVLTPHPGEAAVLLGEGTAEVNARRVDTVGRLQRRYGGSVVLKGVGSLIASAGNTPPALCSAGNPGMASGGMGDALTGVIAGLMAQGLDSRDAAECGVCLHAAAGDAAAVGGQRGLLAGDLIDCLRRLANP